MRRINWTAAAAAILACVFVSSVRADDGTDLRPLWREGQQSRYKITQRELTTITPGGEAKGPAQQSTTDIEVLTSWKVLQANPAGGGVARMTVESIVMKITDPEGTVHTVTAQDAEEGMESAQDWIKAVAGSPLEVSVGADGEIGPVKGVDAVQRKAPELAKRLDEAYFQELAMDLAVLMGGQPGAQRGMKWNHRHTGSHQAGALTYDATCELSAVQNIAGIPIALVNRTSKLTLAPELGDLPPDAPPIDIRLTTGQASAQLMFDTSRHELVGGQFDQTLEILVQVNIQGHNITRTTREVTTTQLLRVSEE